MLIVKLRMRGVKMIKDKVYDRFNKFHNMIKEKKKEERDHGEECLNEPTNALDYDNRQSHPHPSLWSWLAQILLASWRIYAHQYPCKAMK